MPIMRSRSILGCNWCNFVDELQPMRRRDLLGGFSRYLQELCGGAVLDDDGPHDLGLHIMRRRSILGYNWCNIICELQPMRKLLPRVVPGGWYMRQLLSRSILSRWDE